MTQWWTLLDGFVYLYLILIFFFNYFFFCCCCFYFWFNWFFFLNFELFSLLLRWIVFILMNELRMVRTVTQLRFRSLPEANEPCVWRRSPFGSRSKWKRFYARDIVFELILRKFPSGLVQTNTTGSDWWFFQRVVWFKRLRNFSPFISQCRSRRRMRYFNCKKSFDVIDSASVAHWSVLQVVSRWNQFCRISFWEIDHFSRKGDMLGVRRRWCDFNTINRSSKYFTTWKHHLRKQFRLNHMLHNGVITITNNRFLMDVAW